MRPTSKALARELYERGAFGNKFRTWRTVSAWRLAWGREEMAIDALFALRVWSRGGGAPFVADLRPGEVYPAYCRLLEGGWKPEEITVNECAPDHLLLVQGELMRTHRHLYFRYNTTPMRMREGMRQAKDMEGLKVRESLRYWLSPSSYADLEAVLEIYPDAVIELSAYRVDVGCFPGRNMVVWEVREGF